MQKILVVEDDFDIQELLQNFLQEAGYEVAVANDGVEALSLFAGERYDLIVLDIMLPKIDGYGVCELIRKQSDVPIIMLGIGCSRMVKFSIQRQHSAMCIAVVAPPDILDEIDIHPSPAVTAERAVHIDAVRLLTPDA